MEKRCKNKKCQKILPEGYRYKYCENCRNAHIQATKNIGKGILGVATFAITVITTGKANFGKKS
mgnify:CR=1 FL=1